MSTRERASVDTKARLKSKELAARAAGAKKLEAAARKQAQKARARWKHAKRALKEAKRAAKQARKAAKAARRAVAKRDNRASKRAKVSKAPQRSKRRPTGRNRSRRSKRTLPPGKQPKPRSPVRPSATRSASKSPLEVGAAPILGGADAAAVAPAERPRPGVLPDSSQ